MSAILLRGAASGSRGCLGALAQGQQREMNEVIDMWQKAANQVHAVAQCNLGVMYAHGQCVKQDSGEAVGQFNLGTMHYNRSGVMQDNGEALRWLHKAVELGHADNKKNALFSEAYIRKQRQAAAAAS